MDYFLQHSKKAKKWPNGQTILFQANCFKKRQNGNPVMERAKKSRGREENKKKQHNQSFGPLSRFVTYCLWLAMLIFLIFGSTNIGFHRHTWNYISVSKINLTGNLGSGLNLKFSLPDQQTIKNNGEPSFF